MSFNSGFSNYSIPFVSPLPNTSSILISTPDGTGWEAAGIVDQAVSSSVYVVETIETSGNIEGNGAPTDKVRLKNNISLTSITGSFCGSGTGLYNLTASGISNFTTDVRKKLSGSQYVDYNTSSGGISLPYTGSTLGTTHLILGQTTTSLAGITSLSASNVNVSNTISASIGQFNILSASSTNFTNVVLVGLTELGLIIQTPSVTQALTTGSTISVSSGINKISSSGNTTLISVPTVQTGGIAEGTRILISNAGANNITLQRDSNFGGGGIVGSKLYLNQANQTLSPYGTLEMIYISGSQFGFMWAQFAKA